MYVINIYFQMFQCILCTLYVIVVCWIRDLHFHHVHGRNARVSNGGRTASRPRALGEFNDAIVMSNRALREDEMFAVVIEKIVDRWSGSIEAGENVNSA